MLARLWWKDVRQFWPIWLVLVGTAVGCQWLLLRYGGDDARHGMLLPVAMGWALLYGFAVSAAAFAGERENHTLAFLDMLPVSRSLLWRGKASFAVVTTLALAVVLAGVAWLATDRVPSMLSGPHSPGLLFPGSPPIPALALAMLAVVALLLEVVGWGLFWSAVSSNAMIAAVLTMVCSAFGLTLFRQKMGFGPEDLVTSAPWRLALALAASAASVLVVTLEGRPRPSWGARRKREVGVGVPLEGRFRLKRVPGRFVSSQVRALVWQTSREVWPVWWRLNVIGFGLPCLLLMLGAEVDWGVVVLANQILMVVAGVSVFGAESRGNTQRFLAHHGAGPGVVWAVKLLVWYAYLTPVWFLLSIFTVVTQVPNHRNDAFWSIPLMVYVMMTGVAVGQLCGMAIRRGITAGLVAVIGVIAVGLPQIGLASWQMLNWGVPLMVPAALLAVSRAWAGDWMIERPGPARWGRLGLWLAVGFGAVFAVHVGTRVWGVPDVDPEFDAAAFVRSAAVDPKDNAAVLYSEAATMLEVRQWPGSILEVIRRASRLPRCQFVPLERVTKLDAEQLTLRGGLYGLSLVVSDSARRRVESGDLGDAWDDLMVLFRMARHLSGPVPVREAYVGYDLIEWEALGRAMKWATDPRQTPERVRSALDAYRDLPPMPPVIETIRAESILVENTLNLPGDDLASLVGGTGHAKSVGEFEKTAAALHVAALTSPWEVARARRAFRRYFREAGRDAAADPGARVFRDVDGSGDRLLNFVGLTPQRYQAQVSWRLEQSTPLAPFLASGRDAITESNDRNEVSRRALVQILALRHWQLTHDGRLPEALDELVRSGTLRVLPTDPYAPGRPFGYVLSRGQLFSPLGRLDRYWLGANPQESPQPTPGYRLLYSVGPDRRDDQAVRSFDTRLGLGDLVFPLPGGGDDE